MLKDNADYLKTMGRLLRGLELRILECGAGTWLESEPWLSSALELTLVDPVQEVLEKHSRRLKNKLTVHVHNVAILAKNEKAKIRVREGGGSFVEGAIPPSQKLPGILRILDGIPFSSIDPGNISLAFIDMEGSEWNLLATMKSRPKVIVIEVFPNNKHKEQIFHWFSSNGYTQHCSPQVHNFIYVK